MWKKEKSAQYVHVLLPSTSIFNVSLCYLQKNFLKSFGSHGSQVTVRGQPLMIVSGGFYLKKGLFSLARAFQFFSLRGQPPKYFSPGECLSKFFFLGSASQIFFPGECLSKCIFFLESASQNLFFLEKGLNFFFLDFLRPHPQIINVPLKDMSLYCDWGQQQLIALS